jgi:predicted nucleotidyltransferase
MITLIIKNRIIPILRRQGVIKAAIFGSFARGEETKKSDLDLLVKMPKSKTFLDMAGLKVELEDEIGREVDIVEYDAIRPMLKKQILMDKKEIYEKNLGYDSKRSSKT